MFIAALFVKRIVEHRWILKLQIKYNTMKNNKLEQHVTALINAECIMLSKKKKKKRNVY